MILSNKSKSSGVLFLARKDASSMLMTGYWLCAGSYKLRQATTISYRTSALGPTRSRKLLVHMPANWKFHKVHDGTMSFIAPFSNHSTEEKSYKTCRKMQKMFAKLSLLYTQQKTEPQLSTV